MSVRQSISPTTVVYCDTSPTLDVLRGDAERLLQRLRVQVGELENALADAQGKPSGDSTSKKYLRLWKAVYTAKTVR